MTLAGTRRLATALSLLAVAPVAAETPDYFPLDEGWSWTYESSGLSGTPQVWVAGTEVLLGRESVVVSTDFDSALGVSDSFYSRDETGDVYLHGHRTPGLGLFVAYEPPILFLDAPLAAGKSRMSTVDQMDLSDKLPRTRGELLYECEVVDAAVYSVPAGASPGTSSRPPTPSATSRCRSRSPTALA